ncbi:hypothetical protein VKT23_012368 [Stygiomarasmius scandens]|uniref:Uncharacterized protein n=1 Tax=Marasmiellus scandens TaxID=2682957 RepID=A0ABR1J5V7_9AGAR
MFALKTALFSMFLMIYALGVLGHELKPRQLNIPGQDGSDTGSDTSGSSSSGTSGDLNIPTKCDNTCADWQACSGADECCTNAMGNGLVSCLDCVVVNGGGSKADAQDYYNSVFFQGCTDAGVNVQRATINAALSRSQCHGGAIMAFAVAATVPLMLA